MKIDPRCKRLNELSDQYHILFRDLAEAYLTRLCQEKNYREMLCTGDFLMLYEVGNCPGEPAHMAEISRHLNVNPSTATRRVSRLVTDGLITKKAAPDDDRRYDLKLTRSGRNLLDKMESLLNEAVEYVYEPVTDEEMQHVFHYMEKSVSQLEQLLKNTNSAEIPPKNAV